MFGQPIAAGSKEAGWLQHLENVEPASQCGRLVALNLREDTNVCDDFQAAVRAYVVGRPPVGDANEAETCLTELLTDLRATGRTYSAPQNDRNQVRDGGLDQLGRVVTLADFMVYNVFGPGKVARADYYGPIGHRTWYSGEAGPKRSYRPRGPSS